MEVLKNCHLHIFMIMCPVCLKASGGSLGLDGIECSLVELAGPNSIRQPQLILVS